ncbi:restriction endonuclease-related protein [Aureimonas pseudogalii]|uniref:restriction endonuclease-related protein n=1 Tax=Aureimonas pseudogalii TaxID=1744844 RepID=UPI0028B2420B|nr:hypothetical protein [Aureimonas pseudogalii]
MAAGLVEAHRSSSANRDILRQDASMPPALRRGMALVSAVALRSGFPHDIASQANAFTALATRPVGEWGPAPFAECAERAVILVDPGFGSPTADCLELASGGGEASVVEDIFHERLRTALAASGTEAPRLYREVRETIVRHPCMTKTEVLAFAYDVPELATDIPTFFRRLPASALHGRTLRLCGHCGAPLFPDRDRVSHPLGRCAVRECRMTFPDASVGSEHEVASPDDWRIADPSIMTYWVGPGLPEIWLYDALLASGADAELYPMCDAADVGIGGTAVGVDVKSYSSAAVIGHRFANGIGGLRAFRRRIVAIPDFWIRIDRDYLATAASVSGLREGIEFMSVSAVAREFAA